MVYLRSSSSQGVPVADESAGTPPPVLGLHLLRGSTTAVKSQNMIEMAEARQIARGFVIARKEV